jgi:hypothetical protein
MALTQGVHERPILFDPCVYLISSADGPVAGDEAIAPRRIPVVTAVDGQYGVAFHSTTLAGLGVDDAEIDKMRAGNPPSDTRWAAVYDFAREIVHIRGKVEDTALERLTTLGFAVVEVLDIVAECTFAGLVGVVDNLAGRVELDGFLAARAWAR